MQQQRVQQQQQQLQQQQRMQQQLALSPTGSPEFRKSGRQSPSGFSPVSAGFSSSYTEAPATSPSDTTDRYKTELCRSFEEGGVCRYGNKCRFAHGIRELRRMERHPKYKTEFCRTYHTSGFCPYGQRCHFIHDGQGLADGNEARDVGLSFEASVVNEGGPSLKPPPGLDCERIDGKHGERKRWIKNEGCHGNTVELPATNQFEFDGFLVKQDKPSVESNTNHVETALKFFELAQKLISERQKFAELERKLVKSERIVFGAERSCSQAERGCSQAERSCSQAERSCSQVERSCSQVERGRPLAMELSTIIQRRRNQLRCNSVGSGCETPPPFGPGLESFTPSRTSSPMSDEFQSPCLATNSPFSAFSPDIPQVQSQSPRHFVFSRNMKETAGHHGNLRTLTVSGATPEIFQSPEYVSVSPRTSFSGLTSLQTPTATSTQLLYNHLHSFTTARGGSGVFSFDSGVLARLIQRS